MFVKRGGFTLVETVLVVFIIGLLAALLMPVIWKARQRGGESMCISNMRQLMLALELYRQDYGGLATSVPPDGDLTILRGDFFDAAGRYHGAISEGRPLGPYVTQDSIFRCPLLVSEFRRDGLVSYCLSTMVDRWRQDDAQMAFLMPSFAEAYQLRGDDTPLLICYMHRNYLDQEFLFVGRLDGRIDRVTAPGRYTGILGDFFGW